MFFEQEEPDITYDLREVSAGTPSKFSVFWERAKAFLEEDVGTAVDDRRLYQFVTSKVKFSPPDTPMNLSDYNSSLLIEILVLLLITPVC